MQQPTYLTPKQAATRAAVSVSLIYHWCQLGQLVHLRVGTRGRRGKILIAPEDLDNCLASFKVNPRPVNLSAEATKPAPRSSFKHLRIT